MSPTQIRRLPFDQELLCFWGIRKAVSLDR